MPLSLPTDPAILSSPIISPKTTPSSPTHPPTHTHTLTRSHTQPHAQVAILCNHQRSVPRGHEGQMEKMQGKLAALNAELAELQGDLKAARSGKMAKDGKKLNEES